MTGRIPEETLDEFIKKSGWVPGQKAPQPDSTPMAKPSSVPVFGIDELLRQPPAQVFYSDKMDGSGNWVGVPIAMREALEYAGSDGVVATLPYHVAGKAAAKKDHYLWKNWFMGMSEENVGIDQRGRFGSAGSPLVVVVHGGGILTPERIEAGYKEGLTDEHAAKYRDDEFLDLLEGKLPSGESIELYHVDDVVKGRIVEPFGRYGVVLPFETAKATKNGWQQKKPFLENPLVHARVGTLEHLEAYYKKAKAANGDLGNYHPFENVNPAQAQGRVLFLDGNTSFVRFNNLVHRGRFVGVAPEARGAKK